MLGVVLTSNIKFGNETFQLRITKTKCSDTSKGNSLLKTLISGWNQDTSIFNITRILILRAYPGELWQSHASLREETAPPSLSHFSALKTSTQPQQLRLPRGQREFYIKQLPSATLGHSVELSQTDCWQA